MVFIFFFFMQEHITWPEQSDISILRWGGAQTEFPIFAPHEDEALLNETVIQLTHHIEEISFFQLTQFGRRTLKIMLDGSAFRVDPNRIFSKFGCRRTILYYQPAISPGRLKKAVHKTKRLADFLLNVVISEKTEAIVTLHNNSQGYRNDGSRGWGHVSIVNYMDNLMHCQSFQSVNFGNEDEDDLFWVTTERDYNLLAHLNHHVVLETHEAPILADDGSLSYWAAYRPGFDGKQAPLRYFNLELQETVEGKSHIVTGRRMLQSLFWVLGIDSDLNAFNPIQ